ncbi:hypothetical protein PM082_013256 [Marasmius tenuissimus]|nr:hypothetical protein PM082_013256 [Marasmius tenuissimus]
MSSLTRLLHTFPAPRSRAYSSFFSSKPGGGRYFNPSKPPKVVPPATKKSNSKQAASSDAVDSISTSDTSSPSENPSNSHQQVEHDLRKADSTVSPTFSRSPPLTRSSIPISAHPVIGDKDFKLHEFFSLHRPLLLLPNPSSILASAPANGTSIFSQSLPPSTGTPNATSSPYQRILEDIPPEVSYEADAETARNLTRAMTMSRLGSTVAWEATLQKLGLVTHTQAEQAELQERLQKEYRDVVMDSVKRKRRKKMKKHKLKKRRRATRSERLRMR